MPRKRFKDEVVREEITNNDVSTHSVQILLQSEDKKNMHLEDGI